MIPLSFGKGELTPLEHVLEGTVVPIIWLLQDN